MTTHEPDTNESIDVEPRSERALTECMTVLPKAPGLYTVVGENQETYTVDTQEERCTCPDHKHRGVRCKHQRRAAFATGAEPIPAIDGIDPLLGEHTDETPRVAAADGGVVIETTNDRPEDCDCGAWNGGARVDLPCWPCYREGFDTPNPDADKDD